MSLSRLNSSVYFKVNVHRKGAVAVGQLPSTRRALGSTLCTENK